MTRSLVICLMLALATAMAAAGAALAAGWGLIAAVGIYCLFGSTSLVVAALAIQALADRAAPVATAAPSIVKDFAYA